MSFERIAEEKIREASDQGAFSNLPGTGKPLRERNDEYAGDDRMGLSILHENGFLPEWLELRKQIYYERGDVLALRDKWQSDEHVWESATHPIPSRSREMYGERVKSINAKIDLHNVRCPGFAFEIARFQDD